jgi:hypothetical protein
MYEDNPAIFNIFQMNIRNYVLAESLCAGKPIFKKSIFHSILKNYRQALEIQNFHFSICSHEKRTNLIIAKYMVCLSLTSPRAIFSISEAFLSVDSRPDKNQQLFDDRGHGTSHLEGFMIVSSCHCGEHKLKVLV